MRTLYLVEACNRCPLKHPFRICHSSYRPLRPLMLMPRSPTSLLTGRAPCRPPSRLPEHLFAHTPSGGQSTGVPMFVEGSRVGKLDYLAGCILHLVRACKSTKCHCRKYSQTYHSDLSYAGSTVFRRPPVPPRGQDPQLKINSSLLLARSSQITPKKIKNNESWLCHRGTLSWTIMPMPPPMMVPHPP